MTNQQIIDCVEDSLPSKLDTSTRGKILDAVWDVLNNELGADLREESQ